VKGQAKERVAIVIQLLDKLSGNKHTTGEYVKKCNGHHSREHSLVNGESPGQRWGRESKGRSDGSELHCEKREETGK
jgi:hypothetical protein